jgi:hypothetical protein
MIVLFVSMIVIVACVIVACMIVACVIMVSVGVIMRMAMRMGMSMCVVGIVIIVHITHFAGCNKNSEQSE